MEPWPVLIALEHSALVVWLRTSLAYPVLESLHLIGLATMFGSLLIVDLRLLGLIRQVEVLALARGVLAAARRARQWRRSDAKRESAATAVTILLNKRRRPAPKNKFFERQCRKARAFAKSS